MLKLIKRLLEYNSYLISSFITIAVLFLSLYSLPGPELDFVFSDKLFHGIAYFGLTSSWLFSVLRYETNSRQKLQIALSCFVFGCLMEMLQELFTSARVMDLLDVVANSAGILIAYFFYDSIVNWFKTI